MYSDGSGIPIDRLYIVIDDGEYFNTIATHQRGRTAKMKAIICISNK